MANDAMLISVDRIRFMWPRSKKLRIYAVGIAADNRGKVMVTEPASVANVRHLPKKGRPSEWDFAGDGYPLYQRTGGLPDIVAAHLLVVRDRSGARRVGEVVKAVAGDNAAKRIIGKASDALKKGAAGGLAAASSVGLLLPVAEAVGAIVGKHKDQIIQTISGSMFLDKDRKKQDSFSQSIRSPDSNMEVEVDVFLFDAAADKDSIADTRKAETRLAADGLLFVEPGKPR